jgi:hypothetical protein
MDETAFCKLVLREFPSLREDLEEWQGLIHLQVSEFERFTQNAIEESSFEIVSKCFQIATAALLEGEKSLQNAIYVSYLEHLDFRGEAGRQAKQLMPSELKQARLDILDYDERLLGQKRPEDDR